MPCAVEVYTECTRGRTLRCRRQGPRLQCMAQRHSARAQRPALFQEQQLTMVGVAVPELGNHRAATFASASPIALYPQAASLSSQSAYLRHELPPLSPTGIPSSGPVFPPPSSIIAANGSQQLSHRYCSPSSGSPSWVTPPNSPPLFPFPPPIAPPPLRHETILSHPLQPLSPHPHHQAHRIPQTVFATAPPRPTAFFVPSQGHMAVPPQQPHPQPHPQRLSHYGAHHHHHHRHHNHHRYSQQHHSVHAGMQRVMMRQYSTWPQPPSEQPTQHLTIAHPPPHQQRQLDPPAAEQAPPLLTAQQMGESSAVELPLQMPYVMLPGPSGSDSGIQETSQENPVAQDEAAVMVDIETIGGEEEVVTVAPPDLSPMELHEWEECREFANAFKAHREKLGYSRDNVTQQIGIRYGITVTPSSIAQFEQMQLSREDAKSLKKTLEAWMNHTVKAAGTSAEEDMVTLATVRPQKERKTRTMIDALTREQLEAEFAKNQKPSQAELGQIAGQLGIGKDFVRIWFCNRRQRQKKRETRGGRSSDDPTSVPTTIITVPSASHDITMAVPVRARSRRASPTVYIVEESEEAAAPSSK